MIPANKRASGRGFINASSRSEMCFALPPPLDLLCKDCTMPAAVRYRAPTKKALCIGIKYRELAAKFPDLELCLPAAHKDSAMMSELLQRGSS